VQFAKNLMMSLGEIQQKRYLKIIWHHYCKRNSAI